MSKDKTLRLFNFGHLIETESLFYLCIRAIRGTPELLEAAEQSDFDDHVRSELGLDVGVSFHPARRFQTE